MKEQQDEMGQLKHEFERTKDDLINAKDSLKDMTAKKIALQRDQVSLHIGLGVLL